jgi:hypothetical protein
VRFKFRGVAPTYQGPRLFWLILERSQADICIEDPGFEVDLYVDADVAAMAKVWLGDESFDGAVRSKGVVLVGSRELARLFPTLLMLSRFAAVPRPAPAPSAAQMPR